MTLTTPIPWILQLPEELLLQIFRYTILPIGECEVASIEVWFDTEQMRRICQACRHFFHVAHPLVYQTFQFTNMDVPFLKFKPSKQFNHLRYRPEAGRHIRHVAIKEPHHCLEDIVAAFRDPATQSFIHQTYSADFCVFINDTVEISSMTAHEKANDTYDERIRHGQCYQLLAVYALTLAYNVEIVALELDQDFGNGVLGSFFDFCARRRDAAYTSSSYEVSSSRPGRQSKLTAPLLRLHTLEFNCSSDFGCVSNEQASWLLLFPGLVECRTSGIRWCQRSLETSPTVDTSAVARPRPATLRHLTTRSASFWMDPFISDRCGHVIRDVVLETFGCNLETLVLAIDNSLPPLIGVDAEAPLRPALDFNSLGDTLRSHGTRLRRFELDLYEGASESFERKDSGTLGDLRDSLTNLAWLRAPMSRLVRTTDPNGTDLGSQEVIEDIGDLLPKSLRYLWTSLASHPGYEWALQDLLASAEDKLPHLEYVLITSRDQDVDTPRPTGQYWTEVPIGGFHVLFRRSSPERRNTLGARQHPPEWDGFIRSEVLRAQCWDE